MELPSDTSLPFFTYGLFRPGQIGFGRIAGSVSDSESGWSARGQLLERDGLPLLADGSHEVPGCLIRFKPVNAVEAYTVINSIEPDRLYRWDVIEVRRRSGEERANALVGRCPRKGSHHPEYGIWEGQNEPLFTIALDVVEKSLKQYASFEWDLEPFFQLQMAYMLLWTSIERFVSFKYHLGRDVTGKVSRIAEDPVFASALMESVSKEREVYRTDDPSHKEKLIPDNPKKSLEYYYQIRSNITHRGKTAVRDHDMLVKSLAELLGIFRAVLRAEFQNDGSAGGGTTS